MYPYCIGIKTGFTENAGRCLVSCAEKDGIRLICVTLNAKNDWNDHILLYNYGFENTKIIKFDDTNENIKAEIKNGEEPCVEGKGSTSFSRTFYNVNDPQIERLVKINNNLCAPIVKGECIGKIEYIYNGKLIGENLIISQQSINKEPKKNIFVRFFRSLKNLFKKIFRKNKEK